MFGMPQPFDDELAGAPAPWPPPNFFEPAPVEPSAPALEPAPLAAPEAAAPPFGVGLGDSAALAPLSAPPPMLPEDPAAMPAGWAPPLPDEPVDGAPFGAPGFEPSLERPGDFESLTSDAALDEYEAGRQETLAASDPEAFAVESAERDLARKRREDAFRDAEMARIDEERAANSKANLKAIGEAEKEHAAVQAEAKALSEEGVDNSHWWADGGLGRSIAAFAAIALGGWQSAKRGGRNVGLDIITKQIDDDIETQARNLAHRRDLLGVRQGAVAQMFARTGDIFQAKEAVRLAALENLDKRVAQYGAQFDPRGTKAQEALELRMGIRQQVATSAAASRQASEDRAWALEERDMKRREFAKKMAPSGPGGPSFSDIAAADKQGKRWVRDPAAPRGWSLVAKDGTATADAGDPDEELKKLTLEQKRRADTIVDPWGQEKLGKPRLAGSAEKVADASTGYKAYREGLLRLADLIESNEGSQFQGPGSERFKTEARARVDALRAELAPMLAKIWDPVGAVSEGSTQQALKSIPGLDGWTTGKKPMAVYDELVKSADSRYEAVLEQNVDGYDKTKSPANKYRATDKAMLANRIDVLSVERLREEARAPIWKGLDDDKREAAIKRRLKVYEAIADRDGLAKSEAAELTTSVQAAIDAGDLPKNDGGRLLKKLSEIAERDAAKEQREQRELDAPFAVGGLPL